MRSDAVPQQLLRHDPSALARRDEAVTDLEGSREALRADGYRAGQVEVGGATYFRWIRGEERGGGYPSEQLAWKEAKRHQELRAKKYH